MTLRLMLEIILPAAALIIASPGLCAETSPSVVTDAIASLELVHVTVLSDRRWPAESARIAASCAESPAASVEAPLSTGLSGGPRIEIDATSAGMITA